MRAGTVCSSVSCTAVPHTQKSTCYWQALRIYQMPEDTGSSGSGGMVGCWIRRNRSWGGSDQAELGSCLDHFLAVKPQASYTAVLSSEMKVILYLPRGVKCGQFVLCIILFIILLPWTCPLFPWFLFLLFLICSTFGIFF